MATWRQAADAIQSLLAEALAPTSFPPEKIFVGWPEPNTLLGDLRSQEGAAAVSIFPFAGSTLTSRYTREPSITKRFSSITPTITSTTVTFSGTLTPGDNIFIYLNGHAFGAHSSQDSTLQTLASALADSINSSSLGVVAIPSSSSVILSGPITSLSSRSFGVGTSFAEVARITRRMMVSTWAFDEESRSTIADTILTTLAGAEFLTFADLSRGRILYESGQVNDMAMSAGLLKHDQFFSVEYGVYLTSDLPMVGDLHIDNSIFQLDGTSKLRLSLDIF